MQNELIKKAKQGDKEALLNLVLDKKNEYYKLAYVYMKNQEDAMDAMEDMIVILYERVYQLKQDEFFYSWSKTILVNCCKAILRKKNKIVSIEEIKEKSSDDTMISQKEQGILLNKHLKRLNVKHLEVIKLRYFMDYDYENISKILKIPIGTVKSRISIALKKLKQGLEGEII